MKIEDLGGMPMMIEFPGVVQMMTGVLGETWMMTGSQDGLMMIAFPAEGARTQDLVSGDHLSSQVKFWDSEIQIAFFIGSIWYIYK